MAKLVVLSKGFTGQSFVIKNDKTTIGRQDDNDFPLPEASISSHHCEIHREGDKIKIKDLDSTNGTFINGKQISEGSLERGQILRLGQIEMRLDTDELPAYAKKTMNQTMPISSSSVSSSSGGRKGVNPSELQGGNKPVNFASNSPFKKQKNNAFIAFIAVMVILGIVILALLVRAFQLL